LDLPRHPLHALLYSLLSLSKSAVECLAYIVGQYKFSEALAQGGQLRKLHLGLFSIHHGIISSCTHHLWRSHTQVESMQKIGAEMPTDLVSREHMLSHLGMQSFPLTSGIKKALPPRHETDDPLILIASLSF
jgi:hypothetical protein